MIDRTELRTLQYIARFNRTNHHAMDIERRGLSMNDKGNFDFSTDFDFSRETKSVTLSLVR